MMLAIALSATLLNPARAQDPATSDAEPVTAPVRIPAPKPPIDIRAEESDYDLRTGLTRFEQNVTITRGEMEVQADRGRVRQAQGQITEVELEGSPSTWRDRLEDGSIVTGEARNIHFDVVANIVTLTGNAIIRHEQGEFTGDELVYDLTAESLAGRSTGNERVRVVIQADTMSAPRPTPPPTTESDSEPESEPESDAAGPDATAPEDAAEPPADAGTDEVTEEAPTELPIEVPVEGQIEVPVEAGQDAADAPPSALATEAEGDTNADDAGEEDDGDGEPDPDDR